MKKTSVQTKSEKELKQHVLDLEEQLLKLENEMKKISNKISNPKVEPAKNTTELNTITSNQSKIIYFPGVETKEKKHEFSVMGSIHNPPLFLAKPGKTLPVEIPDFRHELQRDGLILLGWDWRLTEKGGFYTAYWVTSSNTPRYYASKAIKLNDFFDASPDHKSYAAEDGIEFYGQEAPDYMVHVAPELLMSNPRHREQRQAHIKLLKNQGSTVDFNYKYLLKTEKKRRVLSKNYKAG